MFLRTQQIEISCTGFGALLQPSSCRFVHLYLVFGPQVPDFMSNFMWMTLYTWFDSRKQPLVIVSIVAFDGAICLVIPGKSISAFGIRGWWRRTLPSQLYIWCSYGLDFMGELFLGGCWVETTDALDMDLTLSQSLTLLGPPVSSLTSLTICPRINQSFRESRKGPKIEQLVDTET